MTVSQFCVKAIFTSEVACLNHGYVHYASQGYIKECVAQGVGVMWTLATHKALDKVIFGEACKTNLRL